VLLRYSGGVSFRALLAATPPRCCVVTKDCRNSHDCWGNYVVDSRDISNERKYDHAMNASESACQLYVKLEILSISTYDRFRNWFRTSTFDDQVVHLEASGVDAQREYSSTMSPDPCGVFRSVTCRPRRRECAWAERRERSRVKRKSTCMPGMVFAGCTR
jgi:hypothetical protein